MAMPKLPISSRAWVARRLPLPHTEPVETLDDPFDHLAMAPEDVKSG